MIYYTPELLEAGYGWAVILIYICFQPAIFEEIAFRGIIQESLYGYMNTKESILLTAILFSILHLSAISFFPFFLVGLMTGLLRLKSKSLLPGMIAHFVHNLWVVLFEMVLYPVS